MGLLVLCSVITGGIAFSIWNVGDESKNFENEFSIIDPRIEG